MRNWKKLNEKTYRLVWDFIDDDLLFIAHSDFKLDLIKLPTPNITHSTSEYYLDDNDDSSTFDSKLFEEFKSNAEDKILSILKALVKKKGEKLYALSWQHEGYLFDPFLPFERDRFNEWLIPALPDGEYQFFLTKDFKNGIFGDGFELSISFFGKEAVELYKKYIRYF